MAFCGEIPQTYLTLRRDACLAAHIMMQSQPCLIQSRHTSPGSLYTSQENMVMVYTIAFGL